VINNFMTQILLKDKTSASSAVLLLTNKFVNEFNLPEKVENYFHSRLNEKDAKTLTYNYIGRFFSIVIIDEKKDRNAQLEFLRKQGASATDAVNGYKGKELVIVNQTKDASLSLAAAEGAALANYEFLKHKPSQKNRNTLQSVIVIGKGIEKEVKELNTVCAATVKARDLVNEPVNHLNALDLAESFRKMGKEAGFKVEVLNKSKIKQLKMGGLLSVNAGSVDEPTFTIMEYKPKKARNKKPVVLVGKGVVYDTGGLSLKPTPNSMDSMKCDMAGAAAVGCAMYAIAAAKLDVYVVGLVPATDNRPGFNAFAPGDIITMMDGSTVEMLNSDAEGRMILADALHYAKRYEPVLTIDVATLTGAAMAAIGSAAMVGMGNASEKIKQSLQESAFAVHERIAEFPFWDDYNDLIKSDIADQKNLGGPLAGAITAGKFLEKFTNYPYYHLDIAGPAFIPAKDGYRPKGGTGYGVRLLFDFVKKFK
jgi:leucyl aminopeptidase